MPSTRSACRPRTVFAAHAQCMPPTHSVCRQRFADVVSPGPIQRARQVRAVRRTPNECGVRPTSYQGMNRAHRPQRADAHRSPGGNHSTLPTVQRGGTVETMGQKCVPLSDPHHHITTSPHHHCTPLFTTAPTIQPPSDQLLNATQAQPLALQKSGRQQHRALVVDAGNSPARFVGK